MDLTASELVPMVGVDKWRFWQFLNQEGEVEWIGVTRPTAPAKIDKVKVWTLLPAQRRLIANWFISADHQLDESERRWVHDSIDGWDFCDAAITVPEPSKEVVERLSRPEELLTFEQINDIPLVKITGKRDYNRIVAERDG